MTHLVKQVVNHVGVEQGGLGQARRRHVEHHHHHRVLVVAGPGHPATANREVTVLVWLVFPSEKVTVDRSQFLVVGDVLD